MAYYLSSAEEIEPGTAMMFYQASAPVGWTQDTSAAIGGATMRGVTGSGGGSGGGNDVAGLTAQGHALTEAEMPSHNHSASTGSGSANVQLYSDTALQGTTSGWRYRNDLADGGGAVWEGSQIRDTGHSHSVSVGATGGDAAHSHNINPKYINVIVATKD